MLTEMESLIKAACAFFGDPYDDREGSSAKFRSPHGQKPEHKSLRAVADKMELSVVKVRKLLITGGYYSTATSRNIKRLYDEAVEKNIKNGMNQAQAEKFAVIAVCEKTGLGRASVYSYLPFKNTAYNLEEKSAAAIRQERWREKKRVK